MIDLPREAPVTMKTGDVVMLCNFVGRDVLQNCYNIVVHILRGKRRQKGVWRRALTGLLSSFIHVCFTGVQIK